MRSAFTIAAVMFTLAACGGGGNGSGPVSMMPETTRPADTDQGDTRATASPVVLNERITGTVSSATDIDFVTLPVPAEGVMTITTTGTANPKIRAYDAAGVEIAGTPGSYIITITASILAKGRHIFVEFYDGTVGETYSASIQLTPSPSLTLADKQRLWRNREPALYMTRDQIKEAVLDTFFSTTHSVGPADDFIGPIREPHETTYKLPQHAAWIEAGFRSANYYPYTRHNGVNVFTATRRFINPEAEGGSVGTACQVGVSCEPPQPVQYTALQDDRVFGGWMDHSYFAAVLQNSCNTADSGCSGNTPAYDNRWIGTEAALRPTGTNPAGIGSASWTGIMIGRSDSPDPNSSRTDYSYIGESKIEIDNLAAPVVNVRFTNILGRHGERHPDLGWNDIPVIDGKFGTIPQPNAATGNFDNHDQIGGAFAGPNHEEVVGTFSLGYIDAGVFGAKRQ